MSSVNEEHGHCFKAEEIAAALARQSKSSLEQNKLKIVHLKFILPH